MLSLLSSLSLFIDTERECVCVFSSFSASSSFLLKRSCHARDPNGRTKTQVVVVLPCVVCTMVCVYTAEDARGLAVCTDCAFINAASVAFAVVMCVLMSTCKSLADEEKKLPIPVYK